MYLLLVTTGHKSHFYFNGVTVSWHSNRVPAAARSDWFHVMINNLQTLKTTESDRLREAELLWREFMCLSKRKAVNIAKAADYNKAVISCVDRHAEPFN